MALQVNRKKESRKLGEQMAGTSEKDFFFHIKNTQNAVIG